MGEREPHLDEKEGNQSESRTLTRKRGIRARARRGKGGLRSEDSKVEREGKQEEPPWGK